MPFERSPGDISGGDTTRPAIEGTHTSTGAINRLHVLARYVLPASIVMAGGRVDDYQGQLWPEEEARIGNAVDKRRREFIGGRTCARRALHAFGLQATALRSGSRGEPRWPLPVCGSISHADGWCAAAVALRTHFQGLGIDLEPAVPLADSLSQMVCTPSEAKFCGTLNDTQRSWVPKLIFSAKESVFKCCYPIFRQELEFSDVEIQIIPADRDFRMGRFVASVSGLEQTPVLRIDGRFAADVTLLMTAALLPALQQAPRAPGPA